jgi:hypothetical protein
MGVRFPGQGSTTIVNASVVTTAQTIICTTPPLNLPLDGALVMIFWWAVFATGSGVTSIIQNILRGATLTSTRINLGGSIAATASSNTNLSGSYVDTPGAVAAQQYSLALTQGAATGNGTVSDVCLIAFAL